MFYSFMFIKSLQIGFVGLFLSVASVWAGPASIQGTVKDAKGQPVKGADVRVESKDGKHVFNTVKTDAKGRYVAQGIPQGVYRVSLVVNGVVKTTIGNTRTMSDEATQLNFDLKPVAAGQASAQPKKGTHKVWIPPSTGSHTGGRWVEVPESGDPGTLNVKRATAEQLRREMLQTGNPNTGN